MNAQKTIALRWMQKALLSLAVVGATVLLPQICHLLGGWLGYGTALGEMLLPMHLPVMLAGMLWGPEVGLVCGLASPVISFALTAMPLPTMVPFMTVELAVYGLTAGWLRRTALPTAVQVPLVQLAGRLVRAAVLAVAVYGFGFTGLPISVIWTSISAGAAGILLQWLVLPLAARAADR